MAAVVDPSRVIRGESMTVAERLASFAAHASYASLSEAARQALKAHVLDALGCAIGALDAGPVVMVRTHIDDFGGAVKNG